MIEKVLKIEATSDGTVHLCSCAARTVQRVLAKVLDALKCAECVRLLLKYPHIHNVQVLPLWKSAAVVNILRGFQ